MSGEANQVLRTAYATSSRSAGDRLTGWLDEEWPTPTPLPSTSASPGRVGEAGHSELDGTEGRVDRAGASDGDES
jgi:hypothetical protein